MSDTPELKECPFCGCLAWLHTHGGVLSDAREGHRIECEGDCHSMTCYWHTKEEAINIWNTRKAPEWMPIETAPKDGTTILAYSPEADLIRTTRWRNRKDHGYDGWGEFNSVSWPAECWMPLPESPK